jgi:hypothetical protein
VSCDLLNYVGLPDTPFNVFCNKCRRTLRVDTGVTSDGLPTAWAHCSRCDVSYCAVNKSHSMGRSRAQWADGRTAGSGERVAVCREGSCGKLAKEYERMLVEFSSFQGAATQAAVGILRERAVGNDFSWLVLQARALLRVHDFYSLIKPALDKKRREAAVAAAAPVMSRAEWLAREMPRQAARKAWFAAEEAALFEAVQSVDPMRELLAELRSP